MGGHLTRLVLAGAVMLVAGGALQAGAAADLRAQHTAVDPRAQHVADPRAEPVADPRTGHEPTTRAGDLRATGRPEAGVVTVLAAASLADAFTALSDSFEAAHPGVRVDLSLGPSQSLAAQVAAGAAADVLATADPVTMAVAVAAQPGAQPRTFARNTVALAVADGADVDSLGDLATVPFALCRPEVPCGSAARRVLDAAGVTADPVTYSTDVTAVLTQVAWGQVDAGLVYASDVRPTAPAVERGHVRAVALPAAARTGTTYPIAALPAAPRPALAQAFVEHVLSPAGRRALVDAGLALP